MVEQEGSNVVKKEGKKKKFDRIGACWSNQFGGYTILINKSIAFSEGDKVQMMSNTFKTRKDGSEISNAPDFNLVIRNKDFKSED